MSMRSSDPVRSQLAEQALASELAEISAWLDELDRRERSNERVEKRVRRLRRVAARLDTRIRLIRDLRALDQVANP